MAKSPSGIEAGAAFVRLSLENKDFRAGLHVTSRLMNRYGAMLAKVGAAGVGVGSALVGSFAVLTKQVANLETQFRRFDLIFKDMSASIRGELKALSSETGVPMSTLVKEASTFGAVFAEMRDDLSDQQFTKVIGNTMKAMLNLAAIGGISLEEAAERLKSGFTSTGESVDQFGFNLRKTALEAEAARLGFQKSVLTMSEQEKQLLKLNIFMRQATRTGISFVSMVDTINGQLTLMRANLVELVNKAGWAIRAAVMPLAKAFNYLLIALRPLATILSPFIVLLGGAGAILLPIAGLVLGLGLAFQVAASAMAGWAAIGVDLKLFTTAYAYTMRGLALTAPLTLATAAWTALAARITAAVAALKAYILTMALAHPILAPLAVIGAAGAVGHFGSKYVARKQKNPDSLFHPDNWGPKQWGQLRRGPAWEAAIAARNNPTPDAAMAASNAAAFSTAGAFGGNIAQRLAFGPTGAGTTAETNSILNMMAEKMGMVTDGDRVKVTNELD